MYHQYESWFDQYHTSFTPKNDSMVPHCLSNDTTLYEIVIVISQNTEALGLMRSYISTFLAKSIHTMCLVLKNTIISSSVMK